jgi:hypothetical protein
LALGTSQVMFFARVTIFCLIFERFYIVTLLAISSVLSWRVPSDHVGSKGALIYI